MADQNPLQTALEFLRDLIKRRVEAIEMYEEMGHPHGDLDSELAVLKNIEYALENFEMDDATQIVKFYADQRAYGTGPITYETGPARVLERLPAIEPIEVIPELTDALEFALSLFARRLATLACFNVLNAPDDQTRYLTEITTALRVIITSLKSSVTVNDATTAIQEQIALYPDCAMDLARVLAEIETEIETETETETDAETTLHFHHQTTSYELLAKLREGCAGDRTTLVVLDFDETLVTLASNVRLFVGNAVCSDDVLALGMADSNVRHAARNLITPTNLGVLNELAAMPNVKVVVVTRRDATGAQNARDFLAAEGIEDVEVIGTVDDNMVATPKGDIVAHLVTEHHAEVVHFADDGDYNRDSVEASCPADFELHLYELDLLTQVVDAVNANLGA